MISQADAPGRTGRELLAGNDPVVEQAMNSRRRNAEGARGFLDGEQFAVDRMSLRLKAWDLPVSAQITDAAGLEAMTLCRGAALAIENTSDHSVGIKSGQSADERDCALVGTHRSWP